MMSVLRYIKVERRVLSNDRRVPANDWSDTRDGGRAMICTLGTWPLTIENNSSHIQNYGDCSHSRSPTLNLKNGRKIMSLVKDEDKTFPKKAGTGDRLDAIGGLMGRGTNGT